MRSKKILRARRPTKFKSVKGYHRIIAIQWDGKNIKEVLNFVGSYGWVFMENDDLKVKITVPQGTTVCSIGSWIYKEDDEAVIVEACSDEYMQRTYEYADDDYAINFNVSLNLGNIPPEAEALIRELVHHISRATSDGN